MPDEPTATPEQARQQILSAIWTETANRVLTLLRETPPDKLRASMLQSITKFLSTNGVTAETLETPGDNAAQALADALEDLKASEDQEIEHIADDTEAAWSPALEDGDGGSTGST